MFADFFNIHACKYIQKYVSFALLLCIAKFHFIFNFFLWGTKFLGVPNLLLVPKFDTFKLWCVMIVLFSRVVARLYYMVFRVSNLIEILVHFIHLCKIDWRSNHPTYTEPPSLICKNSKLWLRWWNSEKSSNFLKLINSLGRKTEKNGNLQSCLLS